MAATALAPLGGGLAGDLSGTAVAGAASTDSGPNPIVLENEKPGDAGSQLGYAPSIPEPGQPDAVTTAAAPAKTWCQGETLTTQLEGYASVTSINRGGAFTLHVRAIDPAVTHFDLNIYRQGWYGGAGGTRVDGQNNVLVGSQSTPTPDPASGMAEATWPATATIQTSASWTSGVYIIVLTASSGAVQGQAAY